MYFKVGVNVVEGLQSGLLLGYEPGTNRTKQKDIQHNGLIMGVLCVFMCFQSKGKLVEQVFSKGNIYM